MKRVSLSDRFTYVGFTVIPLGLYATFYVFQVLSGMFYSFTDWNGMSVRYNLVGFRNYMILFSNPNFWRSLRTTMKYAALLVSSTMTLALILALALDTLKIFKTFTKAVYFIPAMLGAVTVALIWNQMYLRALPVIGRALNIDILKQSPLGSPQTTMFATVFINVWQAVAIPTIIFIAGLQSVPREQYESAEIDGASPLQRFRFITMPGIFPIFIVNLVLLIKGGFTTFDYPYTLTGGGPARAVEVISIAIINDAFANFRFSMANAEAAVLFVIIATISIIQIRLSQRSADR
jgi:raffinose/stachyose/melibiose transport system permease protein